MAFQRLPNDSARRYVNTSTGEIISRRQYDKNYGTLQKEGFSSYEQKAAARKAAGLSRQRLPKGIVVGKTRRFTKQGSLVTYVKTRASRIQETVDYLLKKKGFHQTTVAVVLQDKKGNRKQGPVRRPTSAGVGEMLTGDAYALYAQYDFDIDFDDEDLDDNDWMNENEFPGDFDLELMWSEAY